MSACRRPPAHAAQPATWQLRILFLLLALSIVTQINDVRFLYGFLSGSIGAVPNMIGTGFATDTISEAFPEARAAGINLGDRLISINGEPFHGDALIFRTFQQAQPGDIVDATIRPKSAPATERTVHIVTVARKHGPSDSVPFEITIGAVFPLVCLILGFFVAFARPRDPVAWLLLALMLGMSKVFMVSGENLDGGLWSDFFFSVRSLFTFTGFAWLFLLGVFFPAPFAWERRVPWLKWLCVGVSLFFAVGGIVVTIAQLEDMRLASHFFRTTTFLQSGGAILSVLFIVLFFVCIGAKYFIETSADAKRRLRILYVGTFLAVIPTLTLIVLQPFMHRSLDDYSPWIELPSLLLMLLFPITLAYLILVHKAMDVRVVIRQGLQYTLARGGVNVVQRLVGLALIVLVSFIIATHRLSWKVLFPILAVTFLFVLQLRTAGEKLARWIDRRFFREAYDTELVLAELSENVRSMVETRPLLETVASRIAQVLHVPHIAVLLDSTGAYQPAYALGYGNGVDLAFPRGGTVKRLRESREPERVYLDDPWNWVNMAPDITDDERRRLEQLRAELLLPLVVKDRILGFITLSQKRSEAAYTETDLRLLNSVASQTALALDNARLTTAIADEVAQREILNREIEIAREVQERLLPQSAPCIHGVDCAGAFRPAQGVGGDYYDFVPTPDGKLGIAIGDVSGKGISAALVMANLQASLRSQTMTSASVSSPSGAAEADLAAIISRINTLVYQASAPSRYATFFFAQYDPATHKLVYVNAGHNAPMLFRAATSNVERLDAGGPVVGLLPLCEYIQTTCTLYPGDMLLAFTDGITETMNAREEEWGEDALIATIQKQPPAGASEILARIMAAADAFASGAKQHDDMTMVLLLLRS